MSLGTDVSRIIGGKMSLSEMSVVRCHSLR